MSEEEASSQETSAAPDPQTPGKGQIPGAEKKILCGILAIIPFSGSLGIHKFILGYNKEGIIMAAVTLLSGILGSFLCFPFLASTAMAIIGVVEGIIYLTKSDQEFVDTYIAKQKTWF